VDLQKLPIQEKIGPDLIIFPEEDNIVEKLVADDDDPVGELVTQGAQKLSNPGYSSNCYGDSPIHPSGNDNFTIPSFGKFAAPQIQTRIITQKLHKFEIGELSSPSSEELENIPNPKQADIFSEADIGVAVTKISQALDKMMFSEFEDVMPQFTREAENSLGTSSQQLDRIMEQNQTPLIDLSIPEANEAEASKSFTAYEDLMEIDTQLLAPSISDETIAHDISGIVLQRTKGLTLQDFVLHPVFGIVRRHTEALMLHDFCQNPPPVGPIDQYFQGEKLKPIALKAGKTEQVTGVLPREPFETGSEQQLVSSMNPLQISSSLTQYTLEEFVYSSASSKVVKGRKAGAAEAVKTLNPQISRPLLKRGSLQSNL
jgi:hypothetical protein